MGRNVVIENDKHMPRITKDGVTVVKHIEYVEHRAHRRTDSKMLSAPSSKNQSIRPINSQVMVPLPPPSSSGKFSNRPNNI